MSNSSSWDTLRQQAYDVADIAITEGLKGNEAISQSASRKADRLRVHADRAFKAELKAREAAFQAKLKHLRALAVRLGCHFSNGA